MGHPVEILRGGGLHTIRAIRIRDLIETKPQVSYAIVFRSVNLLLFQIKVLGGSLTGKQNGLRGVSKPLVEESQFTFYGRLKKFVKVSVLMFRPKLTKLDFLLNASDYHLLKKPEAVVPDKSHLFKCGFHLLTFYA